LFAEKVTYFGRDLSKLELYKELNEYYMKWPYRLSHLAGDITILPSKNSDEKTLRFGMRFVNYAKGSQSADVGVTEMLMTVRKVDGEWKIIGLKSL
jgi:hypothetical protein